MTFWGMPRFLPVLLLVVIPTVTEAAEDWKNVAERELTFARSLAAGQTRFLPELARLFESRLAGCTPRPSKTQGLNEGELRQTLLYAQGFCYPWHDAWYERLRPCDRTWLIPKWCIAGNEELAWEHIDIELYFETLVDGLLETADSLVRYNIMAVVAARAKDEQLREYPREKLDVHIARAVKGYLIHAEPSEVIAHARVLINSRLGADSTTGKMLLEYADRLPLEGGKCDLLRVFGRAESAGCPPLEATVRPSVFSQMLDTFEPMLFNAITIRMLMNRIDDYYTFDRAHECRDNFQMTSLDYRESVGEKAWMRSCKGRQRQLLDWAVRKIEIAGDTARVLIEFHRRAKWRRWYEESLEEPTFWVYEQGTWNNRIVWVRDGDWARMLAVEVAVPGNEAVTRDGDDTVPARDRMTQLEHRATAFYDHQVAGNHQASYDFLSAEARDTDMTRTAWDSAWNVLGEEFELLGWELRGIRVIENRATLRILVSYKARTEMGEWKERQRLVSDLWVLQDGNWFNRVLSMPNPAWKDSGAVDKIGPEGLSQSRDMRSLERTAADAATVSVLLARINRYHQLEKEEHYVATYEMLTKGYRTRGQDKEAWRHVQEMMARSFRPEGWRVMNLEIAGSTARVSTRLEGQGRARTGLEYWEFEDGDWYRNPGYPLNPVDWEDRLPVVAPIAGKN